jgi:hypothetical protein
MCRLGVDIGNVIINNQLIDCNDQAFYVNHYSQVPPIKDAFEVLKKINNRQLNNRIYLVSRCPEYAEAIILKWLRENNFYDKTGIDINNIYFCRERKEKAVICERLKITHFVDDRYEVLSYMTETNKHLYLFQPNKYEVQKFLKLPKNIKIVNSWFEILNELN